MADGLHQQGAFDRAFKAFEDLFNTLGNQNHLVTAKYLGLLADKDADKAFKVSQDLKYNELAEKTNEVNITTGLNFIKIILLGTLSN